MDNKAKFSRAYSNVPDSLRGEIIIVLDGEPYNQKTVYFEVKNNTELSQKLLNKLSELKII